jgi:hypothetical protein
LPSGDASHDDPGPGRARRPRDPEAPRPGARLQRCEHVQIDDEVTEDVVATLESHTEPGDDIIFPGGAPTLH